MTDEEAIETEVDAALTARQITGANTVLLDDGTHFHIFVRQSIQGRRSIVVDIPAVSDRPEYVAMMLDAAAEKLRSDGLEEVND